MLLVVQLSNSTSCTSGKTTKYWTLIAQIIRCSVFNSRSSCSLPPYEQVLSRCRWSGGAIPSKLCSKLQLEPESLLQRKYVVCAKKIQLVVWFYFWCSFLLKVKTVSQICSYQSQLHEHWTSHNWTVYRPPILYYKMETYIHHLYMASVEWKPSRYQSASQSRFWAGQAGVRAVSIRLSPLYSERTIGK